MARVSLDRLTKEHQRCTSNRVIDDVETITCAMCCDIVLPRIRNESRSVWRLDLFHNAAFFRRNGEKTSASKSTSKLNHNVSHSAPAPA